MCCSSGLLEGVDSDLHVGGRSMIRCRVLAPLDYVQAPEFGAVLPCGAEVRSQDQPCSFVARPCEAVSASYRTTAGCDPRGG